MACPDDNLLIAMDSLDPALFAEIEVHIDSCEHCRKIVAAAVASRTLAVGTPQPNEEEALAAIVDVTISGRYVIEAVLGRGGMGTVYLARDQTLGRDVALKLHRAGSGPEMERGGFTPPRGEARLHREALAMAKLAHPNVVTVFEIGSVDDRMYVAMEYVRGETLRDWLASGTRTWRQILELLAQAGAGLAAAHDAGLVHRDFKPENVLVGEDGRPRVSDFGLARVGSGRDSKPTGAFAESMTQSGAIIGTPAYMAPEQLAGETVDARCDQFAFCVVAWECLFGKRPFAGTTLAALEDAIQRQDIQRPLRTEVRDVPQRVRDVIERGLAVKPEDRYADIPALLAALRAAALPRTKKYVTLGLASAVLAGAGAVAAISFVGARRRAAECDAAAGEVRALFGPERQFAIDVAFTSTGSPFAAASFERTAKVLAQYTDRLADQSGAACRGGDVPAALTAARRSCLADRTYELASFVDLLATPDPGLVQRAAGSAWAMFDPAPCSDESMLLARIAHPASRSGIRLGKLRALSDAGHYREGIAEANTLLARARAEKDRDLELEILMVLGDLRAEVDPPEAVSKVFLDALQLAETLGRDLEAAGALAALANVAGVDAHDFAAAHRYIALARAKLDRLGGGNPMVRGMLYATEAQILLDENRLGESEAAMRTAVAALEQAVGPEHPKVGAALGTLSQIQRARHRDAEALATSERTLAIFEAAYGPDHPMVAGSEMTVAQSLTDFGRYAEARERLLRADAVFARVYGEQHPVRASVAANLGAIEQAQENWDAALTAYRRATDILEHAEGPDSPYVAGARSDVALVLALQQRLPEAVAEQKRVIAILDKAGPDGESRLVGALSDLAVYELYANQAPAALHHAQRAVAVAANRPADANPADIGDAKFVLGRALWETGGDRVRARKLVDEANPLIVDTAKRAELERWLAAHP